MNTIAEIRDRIDPKRPLAVSLSVAELLAFIEIAEAARAFMDFEPDWDSTESAEGLMEEFVAVESRLSEALSKFRGA